MIELQLTSTLDAVAKEFASILSPDKIKKALANALNAGQTEAKKHFIAQASEQYRYTRKIFAKADGYRIQRANATAENIVSKAFVSSKPVSMSAFVTKEGGRKKKGAAKAPPTIWIKNKTLLSEGFSLGNSSKSGDDASSAGIFMRVRGSAKVAPTKGRYANKIITRGPRKGQLLLRQAIAKKFAMTTAAVANQVSDEAMIHVDLAAIFRAKLDDQVAKLKT